jgi:N-acetylglucosaminyldiphosphoundecaprenol N-acetyl-beta-D-mannosaminyltransferase
MDIMKRCNILGVNICVTNINETINIIEENIEHLKGKYICLSNVHTTVMSYENLSYRDIQNQAFLALPDGRPLSVISRIRGFKCAEQVSGYELMTKIFEVSEMKGYSHYFYGSTVKVLEKIKMKLDLEFPRLKIVGMYSPPFRDLDNSEEKNVLDSIKSSNADFIWVGLGAPKQEIWMFNHRGRFNGVMVGVGAAFDFFSGNIKRAPLWMQKLCLEWLYRLTQDPIRLFKRYFIYNFKFLFCIAFNKGNNTSKETSI